MRKVETYNHPPAQINEDAKYLPYSSMHHQVPKQPPQHSQPTHPDTYRKTVEHFSPRNYEPTIKSPVNRPSHGNFTEFKNNRSHHNRDSSNIHNKNNPQPVITNLNRNEMEERYKMIQKHLTN